MTRSSSPALRYLRRAALGLHGGGLSDGQLLRAFLHNHDECAFEALVRRHGAMIMGVCRRVLRHAHDAEDAFQATFLVLVRRAVSLAGREIVGDWLHGVALRTALKARTAQAQRRGKEMRMARPEAVAADLTPEWHALLDQELQGLPEKYRVPIILCELEGRTHQEAARQLGCPVGTLSGRLSRARAMLAQRLTRRGIALSAGVLAASLCPDATGAGVRPSLIGSTVKAATQIAAGQAAAGTVSSQVAALTEGVVRVMLVNKLKTLGAVVLAVAFLGVSMGVLRSIAVAEEKGEKPKAVPQRGVGPIPMSVEPLPTGQFVIALKVSEVKNGEIKVLSEPKVVALDGKPASFSTGQEHPISLHGKLDFVNAGLTVQTTVSAHNFGADLDLTVARATVTDVDGGNQIGTESVRLIREIKFNKPVSVELKSKDKNESIIRVTATVAEAPKAHTLDAAERDFKVAEFYCRSGRPDSAIFVFELILRRYPDTLYAKQAKEQIAALKKERPAWPPEKKEPDRVGEVVLINKTRIKDRVILEQLGFHPGESFTMQRLLKGETKFLQSGLFANPPKISITYEKSDSDFKTIIVKIEE
jgi:RNA polymerase sigma factor (sigma-70 family)